MKIVKTVYLLMLSGVFSIACAAGFDQEAIVAAEYASIRNSMCPGNNNLSQASNNEGPLELEPVQVFDDLYFLGNRTTSSWALTTGEGIILFDAMFHYNVESTVVAGLKKLNLDPGDIKYVIISHGHNDHFGGASYLQKQYGAKIVMSEQDWQHMRTWPQRGTPAPFPESDVAVKDGDTITLGDTTVTMVITPGHTPGTLSPMFPVHDNGRTHHVAYWGGAAMSFLEIDGMEQYLRSARDYLQAGDRIDVELSNHAFVDGALLKMDALSERRDGEPHPFVTGNRGFKRWMNTMIECAEETLARKKEAINTN